MYFSPYRPTYRRCAHQLQNEIGHLVAMKEPVWCTQFELCENFADAGKVLCQRLWSGRCYKVHSSFRALANIDSKILELEEIPDKAPLSREFPRKRPSKKGRVQEEWASRVDDLAEEDSDWDDDSSSDDESDPDGNKDKQGSEGNPTPSMSDGDQTPDDSPNYPASSVGGEQDELHDRLPDVAIFQNPDEEALGDVEGGSSHGSHISDVVCGPEPGPDEVGIGLGEVDYSDANSLQNQTAPETPPSASSPFCPLPPGPHNFTDPHHLKWFSLTSSFPLFLHLPAIFRRFSSHAHPQPGP